jgi:hypothetical protein
MKTLLILAALASALLFSSCANQGGALIVDGDCLLYKTVKEDREYHAGTCFDEEGKVSHLKFQWNNGDATRLRSTVSLKSKVYTVEYWVPDVNDPREGVWIGWSSKSGVLLGLAPKEVTDAISNGG